MLDWRLKANRTNKARAETVPSPTNIQAGLVAGTLVATARGWTPVEQLSVGDEAMTFDDGLQEILGITRRLHPMPGGGCGVRPLVSVRAGLIGNRRPMLLPDGQAMLVESDFAEVHLGDPFAAVDASELLGLTGARKVLPEDPVVLVTVSFADEQMIFVEGQALAYCQAVAPDASRRVEEPMWADDLRRYRVLAHAEAERVVADIATVEEDFTLVSLEPADTSNS